MKLVDGWNGSALFGMFVYIITELSEIGAKHTVSGKDFIFYFLYWPFLGSCIIDSTIIISKKEGYVFEGNMGFVSTLFYLQE